jgi:hypothetical protein
MAAFITSQDRDHMKSFPVEHKTRIMREIMTRYPVAERNFVGNTHFVKTILKLRADGLRLIDSGQGKRRCRGHGGLGDQRQ